jgi:hypothetical protein
MKEQYLNKCWRPALIITGAAGLPSCKRAGNVLRPSTTLSLKLLLPPTVNSKAALDLLKMKLSTNVPYNCHVTFTNESNTDGWLANSELPE